MVYGLGKIFILYPKSSSRKNERLNEAYKNVKK